MCSFHYTTSDSPHNRFLYSFNFFLLLEERWHFCSTNYCPVFAFWYQANFSTSRNGQNPRTHYLWVYFWVTLSLRNILLHVKPVTERVTAHKLHFLMPWMTFQKQWITEKNAISTPFGFFKKFYCISLYWALWSIKIHDLVNKYT